MIDPTLRTSLLRMSALALALATQSIAQSSAATAAPDQCKPKVIANDVIVTNRERVDVGYHVQPEGIIPNPSGWPFFAWSDTSLGVARTRDGSGYLFFGSDGGCHEGCTTDTQRWGSITRSQGTLDHPLGEPQDDPDPPVTEFAFPVTENLPADIDYAGSGPVYRVPEGEPGAGNLLTVYHIERHATPLWSWTGLSKSADDGITWQDLGLILAVPHAYNYRGASDTGESPLVPYIDPATGRKYFYLFFPQHCWIGNGECPDFTFISVSRAPYEDLLAAAATDASVSTMFHKYYKGHWDQPGLGGLADETFPNVTGYTDGDIEITWSAYRNRFVAMVDNAQYIAYGESTDGLYWPAMQVLLGPAPANYVYGYANAVGLGEDPGVLGDTFFSYYTYSDSWQPSSVNRLTITTAAVLKSIAPSSTTAGGPSFLLTLSGDNFQATSSVTWNGLPVPTTYLSERKLTAQIPAANIAAPGQAQVGVTNTAPCGGDSDLQSFTVAPSK